MGLFDKLKKKGNDETTQPQATPEMQQVVETVQTTAEPVLNNVEFSSADTNLGYENQGLVMEQAPTIQEANLENVFNIQEPSNMEQPIVQETDTTANIEETPQFINDTAAIIDDPLPFEQQAQIEINPNALFEDDKADTITQIVSATVNQENTISNPEIVQEVPVENNIETIGETIVGPTLENSIYDIQTPIEQPQENVTIEDIVATEEAFIPQEIAESQNEVIELESTPQVENTENIMELTDAPLEEMILNADIPVEPVIPEETTIIEDVQPIYEETIAEEVVEPVLEPVITEDIVEEPVISEIIIEETSEPVIPEETTIIEDIQPIYEETITEEVVEPVLEPVITEDIVEEPVVSEIIPEETSEPVIPEETTIIEDVQPIYEETIAEENMLEETVTATEIEEVSEESQEGQPTTEDFTEEIKPIIDEKEPELILGDSESEEEKDINEETTEKPIIEEIIDLKIPAPIFEVSEFALDLENIKDAETPIIDETHEEEQDFNKEVDLIYQESNIEEENVDEVNQSIEIPEEDIQSTAVEENYNEEPIAEEKDEEYQIEQSIEEETDEPVVLPFDITFPHLDPIELEREDEPTKVNVEENNAIYISESTNAKFCDSCGIMITDNTSICPSCGEPID